MSKHLLYRNDLLNGTLTRSFRFVLTQFISCLIALIALIQVVSPAEAAGPLSVKTTNPRFFDTQGKSVYLAGSYLNEYNLLSGSWDFASYLDLLQQQNQNFTRVWGWEQSPWIYDKIGQISFASQPYERTGPGLALDGGLKFDLTRFDQAYFDQIRSRVTQAARRGIYVSVMLFEGFSTQKKVGRVNPWLSDPFQQVNNINGVNGDPNRNGGGEEFFSLASPSMLALQEAFVRKVVDTLNDLDNVLYEVSGNDLVASLSWQYRMIDSIKKYQATKPNQHPVGISQFAVERTGEVFKSSADWIVIQELNLNPPLTTSNKVLIMEGTPPVSGSQVLSASPISLVQLLPDSVVSSQSPSISNSLSSSNGVTLVSSSATSSALNATKSSSKNQQSQVATPTITPNGGVYSGTVPVTLQTATPGASIYYTTDGQSPTQSSRLYTGKFTLSDSTLVKAKAFKSNFDPSAEVSAWFANANAVSVPGLVAYWKFDEGSGTTVSDSSGNGNTGTLVNGPLWTAGRVGNALYFDGIDDNLTIPDSNSLHLSSSFTLSAWVNPASTFTDWRAILVKNSKYYLYASVGGSCGDGSPFGGFSTAVINEVCQPSPLPVNTWTHLAVTYNGSALTLYRNGVAVATTNISGTFSFTNETLQIGGSKFGEYFKGLIDEVRIHNKALSDTEIQTLYQQDSAVSVASAQTVTTPVISPNGGNYNGSVSVTMQTTNSGAAIYYSTDGSTPTQSSTLYTGPINLTSSATVKAKAFKSGSNASAEASASFTVTQPFSFSVSNSGDKSVNAGSSVTSSISTTLASGTAQPVSFSVSGLPTGATAFFSSTSCSPSCSSTLTINTSSSTAAGSSNVTVTASGGGITKTTTFSITVSLPIVPTVAAPMINPNGGSFTSSVSVTMQTATSGASIYYTTNGSTPTQSSTLYTGTMTLTSSATVKAKAFKSGSNASAEASASFTITQPFNFSLANSGDQSVVAGSSVTNSISATLASGSAQAVTLSASGLPTGATASFSSTSCSPTCSSTLTINTSGSTPAGSSNIIVTAAGGGITKTTTFSLTVSLPIVATPAINPNGGSYTGSAFVAMQTATSGASIYYTTNGSSPTQSSTLYTGAITLTSSSVVKAKAFKNGYISSAESSASFTVAAPLITAWTFCATENSPCNFSGTKEVRYGINGVYVSQIFTNDVSCDNNVFGDPVYGYVKQCEYRDVSNPLTVATPTVSPNGGSYTGSASVTLQTATSGASIYYTTDGSSPTPLSTLYTGAITLTSTATVKAKAFKSGYISSAEASASFTVAAPLITAWTFCATENSPCNFSGTKEVRYGINGVYVSQIFTNGVSCDNNVFGDPVYDYVKQCEYRDVSSPPFIFSLAKSGDISVVAGSSATNSITATLVSGSSQAVSFSVSGLPSGATGSFSSTSCNPACSTVLNITTNGSTPAGNFSIMISATGGSVTISTAFTLSITLALTATAPAITPVGTGNIYYVATNGSDSNLGTQTQPFRSITKGVSVLNAGDTLYIRAGTYNEQLMSHITHIASGTSWSNPITISAYPNETVTMRPNNLGIIAFAQDYPAQYVIIKNIILDAINTISPNNSAVYIAIDSSHIRFDSVEVKNLYDNNAVEIAGDFNEIINCNVHDTNRSGSRTTFNYGFYVGGKNNLVEKCKVYNTSGYGLHFFKTIGGVDSNVIRYNEIFNTGQNTFMTSAGIIVSSGSNNQVYANIVHHNFAGIQCEGNGAMCYNNTVYGNQAFGIGTGSVNVTLKNNISYGNVTAGNPSFSNISIDTTGTILSNNLCGGTGGGSNCSLTANPLFVDPAANDFHLQSGSGAIDAGTSNLPLQSSSNLTLYAVTTDFDGVPRPQGSGYDIGAYEYR